jgi:hypothetical protein
MDTDGPGGAERMLAHLVTELAAAGCHNVVLLPAGREGWLSGQLAGTGAIVEYFPLERPLSVKRALNLNRWLTARLQRHHVALAHSHDFAMAVYGAWAAWRAGVPHVTTMHGGRYYAERVRRRLALRVAFALTARVVAVSLALAKALSRDLWMPPSRITTIGNGIRHVPVSRSTLREDLGLQPQDRLVLAVGNLYPV